MAIAKVQTPAKNFVLPNIGEPQFACVNGRWGPAMAHPEIQISPSFLKGTPEFAEKVESLFVTMHEKGGAKSKAKGEGKLHWDAVHFF